MPKTSTCTFKVCGLKLVEEDRENFTQTDEYHWKMNHDNVPFKFRCGKTGLEVIAHREAECGYFFRCICRKAKILSTASVKRHHDQCPLVQERIRNESNAPSILQEDRSVADLTNTDSHSSSSPAGPSSVGSSNLKCPDTATPDISSTMLASLIVQSLGLANPTWAEFTTGMFMFGIVDMINSAN